MGGGGQGLKELHLLLDEHISPRVALALRKKDIDAVGLGSWQGGLLLGSSDEEILAAAAPEGRSLVTFDLKTMLPLLKRLAESETRHAGVVLVSRKTVAPHDIRSLTRMLSLLAERHRGGLENRALFLTR